MTEVLPTRVFRISRFGRYLCWWLDWDYRMGALVILGKVLGLALQFVAVASVIVVGLTVGLYWLLR